MAPSPIRIQWLLEIVDRGVGKTLLAQDRAIRNSLTQNDAAYKRSAQTAASASRSIQSSSTAANSTLTREGKAALLTSRELDTLIAAQRENVTIGSEIAGVADRNAAAFRREGAAARTSAREQASAAGKRRVTSRVAAAGGAVAAGAGALRGAASAAGVGVSLAGFAGLGAIAKQTVDFDRALRNVNSIAQLSEKQLQKVGKSLRDLGGQTAQAPKTLAEGMYDLVSSGFKANDALTIVGAAARAATAGLTTTEVSTKAVAAVLNAYGEGADKASSVSDTLFRTVEVGVIRFDQLAENIGTVLPFAASLGVNLKEVGASISTLTRQGISGELSITYLKNAMVGFLKPSKDMQGALKQLGADSGEQLIKQKGFQGALEAVVGATDGSKKALAGLFPNIRQLTAVLGLTGNNAGKARQNLKELNADAGSTGRALSQQAKSVSYQWNKLKATFAAVAIEIGNTLVPAVNKLLEGLSAAVRPGGVLDSFAKGVKNAISGTPSPTPTPKKHAAAPTTHTQFVPLQAEPTGPTPQFGPFRGGLGTGGGRQEHGPFAGGLTKPAKEPFAQPTGQALPKEASTLEKIGKTVGGVLRDIGAAAGKIGKQLLDAFRPAMPFLQNVLLPLLKGIGKGLLSAIGGALAIVIPAIKVFATVLGFIGKAAAPFKGVFETIGKVIGFVLAGPILKALSLLPKIGKAFELLRAPIAFVGKLFEGFGSILTKVGPVISKLGGIVGKIPGAVGKVAGGALNAAGRVAAAIGRGFVKVGSFLLDDMHDAAGKLLGVLKSLVGKAGSIGGKVAGAIARGVGKLPGMIANLGKTIFEGFWKLGQWIVKAIVSGIKSLPGAIWGAIKGAAGKAGSFFGGLIDKAKKLRGGGPVQRFAGGGMVPVLLSPGEEVVYPGGGGGIVPGGPVAADNFAAVLPEGSAVLTGDGQARMAAGASLGAALAFQAPHFASGGVVRGRVSTFGPPGEKAGSTASGASSSEPGVAIRPGATWQTGKATLGKFWEVVIGAHKAALKQTDLGPNQSTGRRIDVTGAGARRMHIDPSHFPTDAYGTATLLSGAKAGGEGTANLALHPAKRQGLISDAVEKGIERGLAGQSAREAQEATQGVRGKTPSEIASSIAGGVGSLSRKVKVPAAGGKVGGGGRLPLGSKLKSGPFAGVYKGVATVARHIMSANPGLKVSSTTSGTHAAGSYHYQGRAVDLAGGNMDAAANWTKQHYGNSLTEGIHNPNLSIKGGKTVPPSFWGATTWAGHKNHIHIALRRGGLLLRRGASYVTGAQKALQSTVGGSNFAKAVGDFEVTLEGLTVKGLERYRSIFQKQASKGGDAKIVKAFQAAVSAIDVAIGSRIGQYYRQIELLGKQGERAQGGLDRHLRKAGIDPGSSAGLIQQVGLDKETEGLRRQQVGAAEKAMRLAQRTGNKDKIEEAREKLVDAKSELDESITKTLEDARAQVRAAAQENSELMQGAVTAAQTHLQGVEIATRRAPESVQDEAKARQIRSDLVPALESSKRAAESNLDVLRRTGASAIELQSASNAIDSAGNEIAGALADAADLMREAAEKAASEVSEAAGRKTSMAQLGQTHLELEQRLSGTFDSGAAQRADYISKTLIPAIELEITDKKKERETAEKEGDKVLAEQIAEAIASKENEAKQAAIDALEAIKENTKPTTSGTLGFPGPGGETLTDQLVTLGTGA